MSSNLATFASILSYIYMCGSGSVLGIRIRILKAPEYRSNTDPDPLYCIKQSVTPSAKCLFRKARTEKSRPKIKNAFPPLYYRLLPLACSNPVIPLITLLQICLYKNHMIGWSANPSLLSTLRWDADRA